MPGETLLGTQEEGDEGRKKEVKDESEEEEN